MRVFGSLRVALFTTVNIIVNGATLGCYVWLEGRVKRGIFTNWARRFRYGPGKFVKPTTEQEGTLIGAGGIRRLGATT
jgi:hypothetical protein